MVHGQGPDAVAQIVTLRSFAEDGGARLRHLLARLRAQGIRTVRLPRVHPAEMSPACLEMLGFRPGARHVLYAARARPGQV